MFAFQFTTIVYTAGKISLKIFQLVCHAYKMSSMYTLVYGFHTVEQYSSTGRINGL